jgi:hypothetical protein
LEHAANVLISFRMAKQSTNPSLSFRSEPTVSFLWNLVLVYCTGCCFLHIVPVNQFDVPVNQCDSSSELGTTYCYLEIYQDGTTINSLCLHQALPYNRDEDLYHHFIFLAPSPPLLSSLHLLKCKLSRVPSCTGQWLTMAITPGLWIWVLLMLLVELDCSPNGPWHHQGLCFRIVGGWTPAGWRNPLVWNVTCLTCHRHNVCYEGFHVKKLSMKQMMSLSPLCDSFKPFGGWEKIRCPPWYRIPGQKQEDTSIQRDISLTPMLMVFRLPILKWSPGESPCLLDHVRGNKTVAAGGSRMRCPCKASIFTYGGLLPIEAWIASH